MFQGHNKSKSSRRSKIGRDGGKGGVNAKMMEKQINVLRKEIDKKFKTEIGGVNKELNDQYMNMLNMTKL